jgi:hypothetical protein
MKLVTIALALLMLATTAHALSKKPHSDWVWEDLGCGLKCPEQEGAEQAYQEFNDEDMIRRRDKAYAEARRRWLAGKECTAARKAAGRGDCVSAGQAAPQTAPQAQLRAQREEAQRKYEVPLTGQTTLPNSEVGCRSKDVRYRIAELMAKDDKGAATTLYQRSCILIPAGTTVEAKDWSVVGPLTLVCARPQGFPDCYWIIR